MWQPGPLSQQAVAPSLEFARVILHCQQYIFVVTNDYILFSSSETHSGAKHCHQSHCVRCDMLLFTLSTRQCLCVPIQREGLQLLETFGSMVPPHQ